MVKQFGFDTPGQGLHEITSQVVSVLERWLSRLVPEGDAFYSHDAEGPDDMPSHIKAALTASSLSIPVMDGALCLGTWQGIYLWEHRRRGSRREIVVHVGA